MKKIIIFILLITLTGCNYIELNDLSIIKSISIDYMEKKYIINAEIITDVNKDTNPKTKILTVSSSNLDNCFTDLIKFSNKTIHFSHIDLLILSPQLKEKEYQEIFNYFLNHKDFRNDFLVIASNNPKKLLENSNYDEIEQLLLNNTNPNLIKSSIENIIKDFLENNSFIISLFEYENENITFQNNLKYNHNKIERITNEK